MLPTDYIGVFQVKFGSGFGRLLGNILDLFNSRLCSVCGSQRLVAIYV